MKSKNNLEKRLQFYVNQQEIKAIQAEFEASGYNSLSAYLRKKIAGNGIIIPYPKEMLDKLDRLGIQQKRMGNNINQIKRQYIKQDNNQINYHLLLLILTQIYNL